MRVSLLQGLRRLNGAALGHPVKNRASIRQAGPAAAA